MNANLEKWLAYTGGTRLLIIGLKLLFIKAYSGLLQLPPSPPSIVRQSWPQTIVVKRKNLPNPLKHYVSRGFLVPNPMLIEHSWALTNIVKHSINAHNIHTYWHTELAAMINKDSQVKALKPADKRYSKSLGDGLSIDVMQIGRASCRERVSAEV